jgi:hypothetical protein
MDANRCEGEKSDEERMVNRAMECTGMGLRTPDTA